MNSASDMKCRVCGRGNLESAQFCGSCGAKLRSRSMIDRMIGASLLDVRTYEDVEGDTSATKQAFLIVVLVAVASGIGTLGVAGSSAALLGVVFAIAGWATWAWIIYLIGTKVLPQQDTHADWGQLARTVGFAQSPGIIRILGVVPVVGGIISLVVSIWMLATMIVAVRQALDYTSTWRAICVVLLGAIPYAILMGVPYTLLGT